MRRFILPIAAILLTAACGSSTPHAVRPPAHASTRPPVKTSSPAAAPAKTHAGVTKPKSSPTKDCGPLRDIDVWMKVPGLPDSAQVLGDHGAADCKSTFEMLRSTSPAEAGYCTKAAYASDNPGYNADASPAAPLKRVQLSVGPAC